MLLITVTSLPHHCHCQYYQRHHCQSSLSKKVPHYRIADGAMKVHRTSVWPDDKLSCNVVNDLGDTYQPSCLQLLCEKGLLKCWIIQQVWNIGRINCINHHIDSLCTAFIYKTTLRAKLQNMAMTRYWHPNTTVYKQLNENLSITFYIYSHLNLRLRCQCRRYPPGEWLFKFAYVFLVNNYYTKL